jgi:hypothetical protein
MGELRELASFLMNDKKNIGEPLSLNIDPVSTVERLAHILYLRAAVPENYPFQATPISLQAAHDRYLVSC